MKYSLRSLWKCSQLKGAARRRMKLDLMQQMIESTEPRHPDSREYANQHYLPAFFLEGFAATLDKYVWTLPKDNSKPRRRSISTFGREFFYSLKISGTERYDFLEQVHNKIETPARHVIRNYVEKNQPIDEEQKYILNTFLSTLITRTEVIRKEALDGKSDDDANSRLDAIIRSNSIQDGLFRKWWLARWHILETPGTPIVTSDAAYSFIDVPECPEESIFAIPLSKTHLVVIEQPSKELDSPAVFQRVAETDEVRFFNFAIADQCDEYVISSQEINYGNIQPPTNYS
jgi:hypothetical protein